MGKKNGGQGDSVAALAGDWDSAVVRWSARGSGADAGAVWQ